MRVRKARRYAEIRDQMRGIVRQMLAGKARELDAEAERVGKRLEELMASENKHAHDIQTQEVEQDVLGPVDEQHVGVMKTNRWRVERPAQLKEGARE